jgi:hypothetical protein
MSNILEQAKLFIDACDTGKGWDGCKAYCNTDAIQRVGEEPAYAGARWSL